MRRGELVPTAPRFSSVLTVPVPSEAPGKLTAVASAVIPGSISVIRVFPLLAVETASGGDVQVSSDSVVLSCSYSAKVSYAVVGEASDRLVAACIATLVTAENQV